MATKHGSLGEFDLAKSDWKSYVQRAKQYFSTNKITDGAKQRAILLSYCGDAPYRTIKDVLSPRAPGFIQNYNRQDNRASSACAIGDSSALSFQNPKLLSP